MARVAILSIGRIAGGLTLDYFLETFEGVTREQARAVLRHGWERIAAELAG